MNSNARLPVPALAWFARDVLVKAGLPLRSAGEVADMLLWAETRGVVSHGLVRLPFYVELADTGQMAPGAMPHPTLDLPALSILDCGRGPGAVGMNAAVRSATQAARLFGMGMALVRDTTHTGALGHYTTTVANQGMLGIAGAASGPHMAYHNAAIAGVSTGPISIATPRATGLTPLVFDMSSAAVALGKLQQAKAAGATIPFGWAVDAIGMPTTSSAAARTLLPLGGPKGSGLALMLEVLASVLAGNPILAPALRVEEAERRHYQNAFVIAIDIEQVAEKAIYEADLESMISAIKALPAQPGEEVLLPGERGDRARAQAGESGVVLAPHIRKTLQQLADRLGVKTPW